MGRTKNPVPGNLPPLRPAPSSTPPARSASHPAGRRAARTRIVVWTVLLALFVPVLGAAAQGPENGRPSLGFIPLPRALAAQLAEPAPLAADLPLALDWRDRGIITRAKSQQSCGACWSFAATACVEAMCVKEGAPADLDLSEQYPISCDVEFRPEYGVSNEGCCGGTVTIFEFLRENSPVPESAFPYGNGDFDGAGPRSCDPTPSWQTVPCPTGDPGSAGWRVISWSLIAPQPIPGVDQLKAALQAGPVWLGYHVYEDFIDYWYHNADPQTPYTHVDGAFLGGHAVLLIGYDDTRSCWIVKNSWGLTGPFQDGTFLIAYDANCDFGVNAARITVAADPTPLRHATLGNIRALFR